MLLFFCFPFAFFPFVSVSLLLCSICPFYCFFWVSLLFCSISLFFCHLTVSFVFSGFFFMSLFWQEVGSERARGRLRSNRGRFKTKALPHPSSLEEGGFAYHFSLGVPFPYACFFSFVFPLPFFLLFRYLCFYVLYALFIAFFWVSLLFCSISLFFCHFAVSFVFSGFFFMSLFWQEVGSERARGRLRSNRGRFKTKALPHPSSLEEGGFAYHFSWGFPFLMDASFLLFSLCLFSFCFGIFAFMFYMPFLLLFFGYLCFSVLYLFSFAILLFLLYFRVSFLCLFSGRR